MGVWGRRPTKASKDWKALRGGAPIAHVVYYFKYKLKIYSMLSDFKSFERFDYIFKGVGRMGVK